MARPKLLDVFDQSLGTGETAYTRLTSYANASAIGDVLTVQSNPTLNDGATILLNVTSSTETPVRRMQVNTKIYELRDSSGNSVSQIFPRGSRVSITVDSVGSYAYLINQSIPQNIILGDDEALDEEEVGINASTLGGYRPEDFAMRSNTYNAYATAEVIS